MPAGRFAPSPTGPLHLGSLRTALAAWLFARSQNARFLLRVEDLDPDRSKPEHEAGQIEALRRIGLDWDGPVVRQSERHSLYKSALRALEQDDLTYPCFCTRAELREAALAPHGAFPEGAYPGTCRHLTSAEQSRRARAAARPPALRFRADAQVVSFEDRLLGRYESAVDDFVVRRADGIPSYQLAVVVDDADQGIGEVVRGADLAESTPRQILLARHLNLGTPRYAHVPLVMGADGARLAKRHRGATLPANRESDPATLAALAHSLGLAHDRTRIDAPSELLAEFTPARIPRAPVTLAETGSAKDGALFDRPGGYK